MATASASEEVGADGLAQMSIEDFLKQEVPQTVPGGSHTFLGYPALPNTYRAYRGLGGRNCRQRRGGGGGRGQGTRGGRGGASSKRARGGIKPGVIMTHDHPRVRPKSYTTPQSRHLVSVLATGSNEAPAVKERSGGVEDELEAVLTNAQFSYEVTFVLNQPLSVKAGQRCHFLPVRNLNDVRRDTILKLLVGLLNTGEQGVIYLGVEENGRVAGITCETPFITAFVEGLMNAVRYYLMPRLHAPQYGVRFNNVITTTGQILNNMWVVELYAIPHMEHYYNPINDMNYYIRHDIHTKSLPFTAFCEAVVTRASKPYEKEVSHLEKGVKLLKQVLEEKGVDVSSVGPHVCHKCWFTDCPGQCFDSPVVFVSRK